MPPLDAPFPWFGGKRRVAGLVWARFGNVQNYVEPFAGSLAVLLGRPHEPNIETVNDLDCYVANFWRAVKADPDAVVAWADWPVNEIDLHARHVWLLSRSDFRARMLADPDYYDAKIAGWWVWGLCLWIGSGWCKSAKQQLPHLCNNGVGIHRKRPDLGDNGRGIYDWMLALSTRLRRVRVACGDWSRVLSDCVTVRHGVTGVFLDPPYDQSLRDGVYSTDAPGISDDVRAWALANADDPRMRIALCGYEGEHDLPGWTVVPWKAHGGYGVQSNGRARDNAYKERIWFSPHCEMGMDLFEAARADAHDAA